MAQIPPTATILARGNNYPAALLQDFAGGSGTEDDPYLVATAEDLDDVRNYLGAHFLQTADIDLGGAPWNEGEGWEPIGTSGAQFTGTFDGGGYTIHNLTSNRPETSYQGLFGYAATSSALRGIRLRDVNVHGGQYSGGLAGRADGVIEDVSVTGNVRSGSSRTGGLIGATSSATLHRVSAAVTVQGTQYTGGLVGRYRGSEMRHAYATGSVAGTNQVGGLVGDVYYYSSNPIISDSYSRTSVSGTDLVGGLIGYLSSASVYRSYSTGAVSGTGENVGGLIGAIRSGSICRWS